MKKLRLVTVLLLGISILAIPSGGVMAADETDLSSLTVYAVDSSGSSTKVDFDFEPTTYTYDITVMSDVTRIEIEADTKDQGSSWSVEKDGINTMMDVGENLTNVIVTSQSGATATYTLNTTRLTPEEEATYSANDSGSASSKTKKKKEKTVTIGEEEFKIASSFEKDIVPEGFEKTTADYKKNEYPCIKGKVKDITAFYLYNDDTEGFYIYDEENDNFYAMHNIQIKSRMYTIVEPADTDEVLENYSKTETDILGEEVEAWVLDEDEDMYLVYAMNWDGDTALYCYDDKEKCFQRYPISHDINSQIASANETYDNLQDKYNNLVDRYNILLRILCVMIVVIIVLIFLTLNFALNKKERRAKADKDKEGNVQELGSIEDDLDRQLDDSIKEPDGDDTEQEAEPVDKGKVESEDEAKNEDGLSKQDDALEEGASNDDDISKESAPDADDNIPEEGTLNDNVGADDKEEPSKEDDTESKDDSAKRNNTNNEDDLSNEDDTNSEDDLTEKDESQKEKSPEVSEEKSDENVGFYGDELGDEDVLIDITDDKDAENGAGNKTGTAGKEKQEEKKVEEEEPEDDWRSTLEELLKEEPDGSDDFEFIDLD